MTFGEKLHRLRRERGLSQEALAAELGVSRQAVSRWELGEVVPDTANVLAVSRIFGVSTDYLLLDECDREGQTPAAKSAERSLRERQAAVGQGFCARLLWLALIALSTSTGWTQRGRGAAGAHVVAAGGGTGGGGMAGTAELALRRERGRPLPDLVVPDLLAFACAFGLPYGLGWVPGRWGIFLGQLAAILPLVQSIKTLRLHYGLPWGKS
jgi:transcriptional regulator with XRE-family HTH domain